MRSSPRRSEFSKEDNRVSERQLTSLQDSELSDNSQVGGESNASAVGSSEESQEKTEVQHALLIEVAFDCECGRHYRVNFKNLSVVVQKENELFEHVDMKPRTFQVHCGKCNSEHEFAVDGTEGETKQVFCRRCKPLPRKGVLDVNTGEVTWLD